MFEENLRKEAFKFEERAAFYKAVLSSGLKITHIIKSKYEDGKRVQYKHCAYDIPCSFDIENTSTYYGGKKISFMYIWQLGINGLVITGRTWEEYKTVLSDIKRKLDISPDGHRLIIYVHNLDHEFQFIRKLFDWDDVFCMDNHKILYAVDSQGFEYRCSLKLTSKSLEEVGNSLMKYKVKKMVGDLDYNLIRTEKTVLTDEEMGYCINDVRVVMALIQEKIEEEKHGVLDIPFTSTGYVRRYCRKNTIKKNRKYREFIQNLRMSYNQYLKCKKAFAGGFTHGNANLVGYKLPNVDSYDVTSDYPTVCVCEKFPMSNAFYKCSDDFEDLMDKYCCIFSAVFIGLRAVVDYDHILSSSKCEEVKPGDSEYWECDNGRIIKARRLRTTMTNVDWYNFKRYYKWDKMIIDNHCVTCYKPGYLPKEYVECILDFYRDKTTLKDVKGEEREYQRKKGMLNGTYGMMCEDPLHACIIYENDNYIEDECKSVSDVLEAYNNSRNRFIYYPWAVFVTAWARKIIFDAIIDELKEDYIYSDTDSLKMLNGSKHQKYFKEYDSKRIKQIEESLKYRNIDISRMYPKTIKGKEKPLGVFDWETEDAPWEYAKFMGAKRYMVQTDGKITITIAGLGKKKGGEYISKQSNPWDFFNDGMYIPPEDTGKLTHTYIDDARIAFITDYQGNSCEVYSPSAVHLEPCEFSLSLADEYIEFLNRIRGFEI